MKRLLKYAIITLMITVIGLSSISAQETVKSGFKKLDLWTEQCHIDRPMTLGYPCNQVMTLTGFYKWYTDNKMETFLVNNAGDPFGNVGTLSSGMFEREVIEVKF